MPGLSFLFKKRFHPMRWDNQKKLFIAEQTLQEKQGREKEFATQVKKERELQDLEGLGKMPDLDPRASSLKFMYAAPAGNAKDNKKNNNALLAAPAPTQLDENGDDDAVRAFKQKIQQVQSGDPPQAPPTHDVYGGPLPPQPASSSSTQPARRPPSEGSYLSTLSVSVQHKPLGDTNRTMKCMKCGGVGHGIGERACPLFGEKGKGDGERLRREDPMWVPSDRRGEESSDPEAEFLQTLTRREKMLLLRKLSQMEGGGEAMKDKVKHKKKKRRRRSASSSSSSSSSSSGDEP